MFHVCRQMAVVLVLSSISWAPAIRAYPSEKFAGVVEESSRRAGLLWRDPGDIRSRNLFYGSGGREHQPEGPFTFLKEDREGTNPKFVVRDRNGVNWKVKLGREAKPETVASRLVWAMGYFVQEEYFLETLQLENKPPHLKRGRELMHRDGSFSNVRLKRDEKGQKKIDIWSWRDNSLPPRQLNGLRVMMALINNWDLKNVNNAIYEDKKTGIETYMVTDLGGSFGTPGISWSQRRSKGDLHSYEHSKFITKVNSEYVDFAIPARPALVNIVGIKSFFMRLGLRKIGKNVPREDAHWIGEMLARLSPEQIRDSFRAGGYSPEETEAFARVVEHRISLLKQL